MDFNKITAMWLSGAALNITQSGHFTPCKKSCRRWYWHWKSGVLEENTVTLSHCHLVKYKSNVDWLGVKSGPAWWADDTLQCQFGVLCSHWAAASPQSAGIHRVRQRRALLTVAMMAWSRDRSRVAKRAVCRVYKTCSTCHFRRSLRSKKVHLACTPPPACPLLAKQQQLNRLSDFHGTSFRSLLQNVVQQAWSAWKSA
jgi:hypothetical protein